MREVVKYCEERFQDGRDYEVRTQDFTDEELRKAFLFVKPYCWDDIADYLEKLTDDPDVRAHLKGFASAEEREKMVAETKRLQGE